LNDRLTNLEEFCAQLGTAWHQSATLVALLDVTGSIMRCNPAFGRWLNLSPAGVRGMSVQDCVLRAGADTFVAERLQAAVSQAAGGQAAAFEIAGSTPPLSVAIEPLYETQEAPVMLLLHAHDISEHVATRLALERMAHYDPLTGLPNRALFADRLRLALARARRDSMLAAVCYLDLDGFKEVNDQLGHEAGDRLLIEIAARLNDSVRGGDTVARLGGDEFILIIGNIESPAELDVAMLRVLTAASRPVAIDNHVAVVSASIGVALFPLDSEDADVLIRHADQAMYSAKQAGKNRYHLFDRRDAELITSHRDLMHSIEQALHRDEFELLYQPKVSLRSGKVVGAEALLRWQHPQRGMLAPADFLDALETSDLAVEVGRWVLQAAVRQADLWHRAGLDLVVAINVSPHHLNHPGFVIDLSRVLDACPGLPHDRIELEISEHDAIRDAAVVGGVMRACERLGVRFAIDNFGTGRSSLGAMSQLPARTLKIDRRFIADMLDNPEDLAIIDGIIGLTSVFNRNVAAEGMEVPEHGALLLQLGCDIAQGYGIARPMRAAELPAWLAGFLPDPTWHEATRIMLWHDDLPLLKIEIDQRIWMRLVRQALDGLENGSANLDIPACPAATFTLWAEGVGKERFGKEASFRDACRDYARINELARRLCDCGSAADSQVLEAHWRELSAANDDLLADLGRLKTIAAARVRPYPWTAGEAMIV